MVSYFNSDFLVFMSFPVTKYLTYNLKEKNPSLGSLFQRPQSLVGGIHYHKPELAWASLSNMVDDEVGQLIHGGQENRKAKGWGTRQSSSG